MAAMAESSTDQPSPPIKHSSLVQLGQLSQSELVTLSLSASSTHRRKDEPVPFKIDRNVFNESAGSRRQTYSRLRLLPHNKQPPPSPVPIHIPPHPAVDEENSQIISLLQDLFGVKALHNPNANAVAEASPNVNASAVDNRLIPVPVDIINHPLYQSPAVPLQDILSDVADSSNGKRKRGRPRKNENSLIVIAEEEPKPEPEPEPEPEPKRRRQRKEKEKKVVQAVTAAGADVATMMVNEKGLPVDAAALGEAGDPFAEEIKKRTLGLDTEAQLSEFLEGLNGEWASKFKKRRIVLASELVGDLLPKGWKIVLILQRRARHATVLCRRYISPDGNQFDSFKEVSAYLQSFFGVQDQGVVSLPKEDTKTDVNASGLHLASTSIQATATSSIENEMLNSSDGNFNSHPTLGYKLGDYTGCTLGYFDHQTEDKCLPLKADKSDANSVQGCSVDEDRVHDAGKEKLVGAVEAGSAASNLHIPLVLTTPVSNNNSSGICQSSDKINAKSGMSTLASQDRNLISSVGDMGISDGKLVKDDCQIFSTGDQSDNKNISTIAELHSSTDRTLTSMLKHSAEGKCFDSDLPSPYIDERTYDPSGYSNNVSVSTHLRHASESDGVFVAPNLKVAEDVVTSSVQERNSSTNQNCEMDSMLQTGFDNYLFIPEYSSAFDDDVNNISGGTFDALKPVDADCKKPHLDDVSGSNALSVDAYTTTASAFQGKSQGFESVPSTGSILTRLDEQSAEGVNSATNKSCVSEKAQSEAEMFRTDFMDICPKFQ